MSTVNPSETPAAGRSGRPANPVITAQVLATVSEVIASAGFWPSARLAAALNWEVETVERLSRTHPKMAKLRRRADIACRAKLAEIVTERALSGADKSAAAMILKNEHGWLSGRDGGGAHYTNKQKESLDAFFDDLAGEGA